MNLKYLTDTELILIYQDTKNGNAFGELYNRYETKVFLYCIKILKEREDAHDVTQDIFLKLTDKLLTLKETFAFKKWLYRIAQNDCITVLRNQQKFRYTSVDAAYDLIDSKNETESIEVKEQQIAKVNLMLAHLSERDQTILKEKYLQDLTIVDLMEKYNLSESAVKMKLSRARNKVRNLSQKIMVA